MPHSEACGEAYRWSRDAWKPPVTEGSQDGVSDSSTASHYWKCSEGLEKR